MRRFEYLKAFFSPFKRPKLKWYFGKVAVGTPYFLPRKWVKATPQHAKKAALKEIKRFEDWNELNKNTCEPRKIPPFDQIYKEKLRYKYAVPKKIGFDFVKLGYKTKWSETDYRFEYAPLISFVFFKWQIAVTVAAPEQFHYWEAWLFYYYHTEGTRIERIKQCKRDFSMICTVYTGKKITKINYYEKILKPKYAKIRKS